MTETMQEVLQAWQFFFSGIAFVLGTCIGSFLNVCIYRIPLELSVVTPRSHCPHCEKLIPWYLNIPLVSFLMLHGKCRNCGGRISPRYFLVELLVGVLFLLAWLKFDFFTGSTPLGLTPALTGALIPVYWLVVSGLVLGTFVDFEHLIIPDRVTLGGIAAGLVLSLLVPELHLTRSPLTALARAGIGLAAGWGSLWAVAVLGQFIFKKEAMGFGDVKLLGAIGAFFGWRAVLFTIVVSSFTGSIVGIALVATAGRKLQSRIPYGPYIALAALLWMYWGPALWDLYINLLTPGGPRLL